MIAARSSALRAMWRAGSSRAATAARTGSTTTVAKAAAASCVSWMHMPAAAAQHAHMLQYRQFCAAPNATGTSDGVNITPDTKWDILYGSQTGTAYGFSLLLEEELTGAGVECEVTDLFDIEGPNFMEHKNVVLMMSCYGTGEPTDSATEFYEWLMDDERKNDDFSTTNYCIFGLGSSKTHGQYYNVVGREVDARLQELGAHRILERGEGDDSGVIEADFEDWTTKLTARLLQLKNPEGSSKEAEPAAPSTATVSTAIRTMDFVGADSLTDEEREQLITEATPHPRVSGGRLMRVSDLINLTPGIDQPNWELRLSSVSGDIVPYTTSDHVNVSPSNRWERVEALCNIAGWDPNHVIKADPESAQNARVQLPLDKHLTIGGALTHYIDVDGPVPLAMLRVMMANCEGQDRASLESMTDRESYVAVVKHNMLRVSDLLEEFPSVNLPFEAFVRTMVPLQQRSYSISSSWKAIGANKGEVHLSFRHVRKQTPVGDLRLGACTTWMTMLEKDSILPITIRPSTFRLPEDPSVPIICVSGGIGIAPFKAFMEERLYMATEEGVAMGPGLLFHGCRNQDDLIYGDLMQAAKDAGAMKHTFVAYSGPEAGGKFIHQEVLAQGAEIWDLMQQGAIVYLCGGATGFGKALAQSFRTIAIKHGGLTYAGANTFFADLLKSGRYQEDLSD